MEQIQRYNCDGLCAEKYCDERYTQFTEVRIESNNKTLTYLVSMCDKHANKYEEIEWDRVKENKPELLK